MGKERLHYCFYFLFGYIRSIGFFYGVVKQLQRMDNVQNHRTADRGSLRNGRGGGYVASVTADFNFRNQGSSAESMQARFPMEGYDRNEIIAGVAVGLIIPSSWKRRVTGRS
jgi:hypothetical protein